MKRLIVLLLAALLLVAPGIGVLGAVASPPAGAGFEADAVSAASPNYRVFSETDLKSMKKITQTVDGGGDITAITEELAGGHYTCQKNSDPFTYFEQDWKGVDLSYLLNQEVGLKAGTTGIRIIAADGYAVSLSLADIEGYNGLPTLLGYLRGASSADNPPNGEGTMDGTGTFPSVDPVATDIELDAEDGPFRLVLPQATVGPDPRNAAYNPAGAGSPNWNKSVMMVRAIEVQPVAPGIPAIDPEAIPENQVVVYGNIQNRHTFTVDQLKSINPISATYHWKNKADTEGDSVCTGIEVSYLLDSVLGLQDAATDVKFIAADNWFGKVAWTLDEIRQLWPGDVKMMLAWNVDGEDLGPEPDGSGPIEFIKPQADAADTNKSKWISWVRTLEIGPSGTDPLPDPAKIPTDRIIVNGLADAGNIPNEWFLPEGCTGYGFEEWILIQNPNPWQTHVIVDYMIEGEAMQTKEYNVPAESRFSIDVASQIGEGKNVSARVEGYHGDSIVVERAMYWMPPSEDNVGGHCSGGIRQAGDTWYLAEGATADIFETWVLVQNPGDVDTTVDFTLMTDTGPQTPAGLQDQTVAANSRRTFNLGDYVQSYNVSTLVEAAGDVIVERAVYWNGRRSGSCAGGVAGPGNEWYLAEGATADIFETWVLVQNPGDASVNIDMDLITDTGVVQGPQEAIPANSRKSYNLVDYTTSYDVSTRVSADGEGVIVERAMYWNNKQGGHCESANDNGRFKAYLAEGATAYPFETWVLFQNPGTVDATIYVTYLTDTGVIVKDPFVVAAGTRTSVNVVNDVGEKYDVSTVVSASAPVVVERAVYWGERMEGSCAKGLSTW